jgi:hypothetical protein
MSNAVMIGSWIELDDVDIEYVVPEDLDDDVIEFRFAQPATVTLHLSERALTRCVEAFPEALAKLKARRVP